MPGSPSLLVPLGFLSLLLLFPGLFLDFASKEHDDRTREEVQIHDNEGTSINTNPVSMIAPRQ